MSTLPEGPSFSKSLWPEAEFQRVAISTKLSERTLAACRDVLVHGVAGIDSASTHGLKSSAISRGLGVLRDRREEISKSAGVFLNEGLLLRFAAAEAAKQFAGDGLTIVDAHPGFKYEGKIVAATHGFAVQQQGRFGIMHDLGNLDRIPTINTLLTIDYPIDGSKASVIEKPKLVQEQALSR